MAQMPQLNKEILEDVEYFADKYYVYDDPIPFKEHLTMYPVTVKNYNEFLSASMCLTLNKNDSIEGIKMTSIEYLISKMKDKKEGPMWSLRFTRILELCLHVGSGLKCPKCGHFMSFEEFYKKYEEAPDADKNSILICECGEKLEETIKFVQNEKGKTEFVIDGVRITAQEFNKLKNYIMYQNLPDYKDDSWVDKAIRDDQAAYAEIKSRGSGKASIERKIIAVALNANLSVEQVCNLSIRKFLIYLGMICDLIDYKITKQALMSGFASLPKGETIEHWLYKKNEGIYGKAMDADAYKAQINNS